MKYASICLTLLMTVGATYAASGGAHDKGEEHEGTKSQPALANALKDVKVSLLSGLKAAAKEGTPISGKFEVEGDTLQLSVYTMKGDKFFEVIVDHKSGKVAKTEPITSGEDLTAAKNQAAALGKGKGSLVDAVTKAEKSNPGYKAVSVVPELEEGAAEADVSLLKGTASKMVDEKL